jgi:chromosome segregation ATPase
MLIKYYSNGKELCFRHATIRALQGEDIRTEIEENPSYYATCECDDCDCTHDEHSTEIAQLNNTIRHLREEVQGIKDSKDKLAQSLKMAQDDIQIRDRYINKLIQGEKLDPEDAEMEEKYTEKLRARGKIPPRRNKPSDTKQATTELIKYLFSIVNPQPQPKREPIVYDEAYKQFESQVEDKLKGILEAIDKGAGR